MSKVNHKNTQVFKFSFAFIITFLINAVQALFQHLHLLLPLPLCIVSFDGKTFNKFAF